MPFHLSFDRRLALSTAASKSHILCATAFFGRTLLKKKIVSSSPFLGKILGTSRRKNYEYFNHHPLIAIIHFCKHFYQWRSKYFLRGLNVKKTCLKNIKTRTLMKSGSIFMTCWRAEDRISRLSPIVSLYLT